MPPLRTFISPPPLRAISVSNGSIGHHLRRVARNKPFPIAQISSEIWHQAHKGLNPEILMATDQEKNPFDRDISAKNDFPMASWR